MARDGIFSKLLSKFTGATDKFFSQFKFMNSFTPIFTSFGSNAYKSSVTRSAINAIAQNGAKLKPRHIKRDSENRVQMDGRLDDVLARQPNVLMNAYDFYLKLITQLLNKNNAFALLEWIDGRLNIIPVNYSSVEALEAEGMLFMRFYLLSGEFLTIPYVDLIHLRRHFYDQDVFGESNDALLPTLEVINTMDEGLVNAVKSSASLRGIIKANNAMLKQEDIKKQRDDFVASFLGSDNNGGIGALDAKLEWQEINNEPKFINPIQAKAIKERVYEYYHVNEEIVQSKYDENQWNAFYESVLEPLAIQMSLEFTNKIFTPAQRSRGAEIIFEANRLAYASNTTKIALARDLMPMGVFTPNEIREVFNMGPIETGDVAIQSLNFVKADKVDQYQNVSGESNNPDNPDNPIPEPEPNETQDDYIAKVISLLVGEGMDAGQAYKVALEKWNEKEGDDDE